MKENKPKKFKPKKANALQCPFCLREFTSLFYKNEHWCQVLKIELKHHKDL